MSSVRWVYPESFDDLRRHLADGVVLHGGGTGLLRNPPRRATIAALSRLGLSGASKGNDGYRFGATTPIARVVETIVSDDPSHIVAMALSRMATPALRNRITLGGSVAFFPPWSCVIGPLLVAGTGVELVGNEEGSVGLEEYLSRRELRAGTAVVGVAVASLAGRRCSWFSFSRTRLNYPLFTVAAVGRGAGGTVNDLRIVITGTEERYSRLQELESRLSGAGPPGEMGAEDLGVAVPGRQGFSGEYLTHLAAVAVRRAIADIAGGEREPGAH